MKRLLVLVVLLLALPNPSAGADKPGLAGRMLVASEKLKDPYFQHSVVYIVEHDGNGAIGLIVNRRMGAGSLAELVAELGFSLPEDRRVELYFGGPVSLRGVFVLHTPEYDGPRTLKAPNGLAMTGDKDIIKAIANGKAPKHTRMMMGYAGWGAGQLEGEIERGDSEDIWRRARDKAGLTL